MNYISELTLVFVVSVLAINAAELEQHERQHQEVFRIYGVPSEVTYNWFGMSGYTETTGNVTLPLDYDISLREQTAKIEIDGYNHAITINAVLLSAYLVGYALLLPMKKKQ